MSINKKELLAYRKQMEQEKKDLEIHGDLTPDQILVRLVKTTDIYLKKYKGNYKDLAVENMLKKFNQAFEAIEEIVDDPQEMVKYKRIISNRTYGFIERLCTVNGVLDEDKFLEIIRIYNFMSKFEKMISQFPIGEYFGTIKDIT